MKKLLIAVVSLSFCAGAFAEKTTEVTFDSTKMKCGNHHISDGINKKQLKTMRCKNYQDKKTAVVFIDDNSHKTVDCKVDHTGNLTITTCQTI